MMMGETKACTSVYEGKWWVNFRGVYFQCTQNLGSFPMYLKSWKLNDPK